MADLSKKTRFCNVCIRKDKYPSNFEEKFEEYCKSFCETYTYIKHEGDINLQGEIEGKHYHLVAVYKKNQRLSTRLNDIVAFFGFPNPFGIQIDKTISNSQSIQYLIHKNNPEKTTHSMDEIVCNYDRGELKCIIESDHNDTITFDYLITILSEENNIADVIRRVGLQYFKVYRLVIWDLINASSTLRSKFKC